MKGINMSKPSSPEGWGEEGGVGGSRNQDKTVKTACRRKYLHSGDLKRAYWGDMGSLGTRGNRCLNNSDTRSRNGS